MNSKKRPLLVSLPPRQADIQDEIAKAVAGLLDTQKLKPTSNSVSVAWGGLGYDIPKLWAHDTLHFLGHTGPACPELANGTAGTGKTWLLGSYITRVSTSSTYLDTSTAEIEEPIHLTDLWTDGDPNLLAPMESVLPSSAKVIADPDLSGWQRTGLSIPPIPHILEASTFEVLRASAYVCEHLANLSEAERRLWKWVIRLEVALDTGETKCRISLRRLRHLVSSFSVLCRGLQAFMKPLSQAIKATPTRGSPRAKETVTDYCFFFARCGPP